MGTPPRAELTPVHRRLLGQTGNDISVIGFGAWQIGGPGGEFAWKPQDDRLSIAAIHAALDRGVNWIDTAPAYGCGHSEAVVGRTIAGLAEKPLVFTKCGCVWDTDGNQWFDLSPESLRREVGASLRRLGVDAIDLYQLHWPIRDDQIELAWETLEEFKRAGLVRAIGASNVRVGHLERLRSIAPVATIQPGYSLLDRRFEEALRPYAREHRIGVVAYSPLQSGLLGGTITRERMESLPPDDWRRRDPQFQEPHLSESLAFVRCLTEIARSLDASVAEVAVAWVLRDEVVSGAIVGFSRPDQVDRLVGAASLDLRSAVAHIDECLTTSIKLPRPADRFVPPSAPSSPA
jgi:aryl-alcohol dehydrogenase-like predicted oxidoreductase